MRRYGWWFWINSVVSKELNITPKEVLKLEFREFISFIKFYNESAAAEQAIYEEQKRKSKNNE